MTRTAGLRGRLPAKPPAERFALGYVHEYAAQLPPPQYPVDVSGGITDFLMLGNGPDPTCTTHPQGVGDCTFAGRQHLEMTKAAAGNEPMPTETSNELVKEYLEYDHGQDVGANIADLLLTWYRAGKIAAFAPVDHTDPAKCDAAMQAFHGLYCGVDLTDDADDLFEQGQPWTVADGQQPDESMGHCIVKVKAEGGAGYDTWVTWGALQDSTPVWTSECLGEAWAVIMHEDEIDPAALAQLRADIDALGGTGGDGATPTPAPQEPESLLTELTAFIRGVAASVDGDLSNVMNWLHEHGL